ncbi:MAG: phosphoribosyl-AMP cyclohydrolase [Actinobacteria bacterium]|nr:phosphoribosyl-AMP cyclohydrolase [Actinomycetota bacterium]
MNLDSIKFDGSGLIPAIAQDAQSGQVLMLAWMNREALELTISTRKATYWSRSRQEIWVKGETSGSNQEVVSIFHDCDKDAILLKVNQSNGACHTGDKSCFDAGLMDEISTGENLIAGDK